MPRTTMLTTADIVRIGSGHHIDPGAVAAELIAAVDERRIESPYDTAAALTVAATLTRHAGDLPGALALADRAIVTAGRTGETDWGPRLCRAGVLRLLGRTDDAMAEFTELRVWLTQDVTAMASISSVMREAGLAETVERWLTDAFNVQQYTSTDTGNTRLAVALLGERHDVRRDLGLPLDRYDTIADGVANTFLGTMPEPTSTIVNSLVWSRHEFDRMLERWPSLRDEYGETWDDYRANRETTMAGWSESAPRPVVLLAATVDGLAGYVGPDGDPLNPDARSRYIDSLGAKGAGTMWPPGRNDACWCTSGVKYKKCCLPRSRR